MMKRRQFFRTTTAAGLATLATPLVLRSEGGGAVRFGLCTGMKNAAMVKKAGGDFVELTVARWLNPDGSEETFAKRLKELKESPLPVPVCNSFIRRKNLHCVGPEANHEDVLAYVKIAFDRAQRAGVETIVFGSTGTRRLPNGWSKEKGMDQFVAVLKAMAPLAAAKGVTVAVEPLTARECNFINSIKEIAELGRRVDHKAVSGVADIYHMVNGGDKPSDLEAALPWVHHVELAQHEGRTLPKPGGDDFRPWLRVLKKSGFSGTMSMEGRWKTEDVAPAFAEMRKQWASV